MSLIFTEDQLALSRSVEAFVARRAPLHKVRELITARRIYDPDIWQGLSKELGLTGLLIPELYGGAEASRADLSVALRALGAGLVPSPLLSSGVMAAGLLLALDDDVVNKESLPWIATGALVATVAVSEGTETPWIPITPATTARPSGNGATLHGTKTAVLDGSTADLLLVQATGPGGVGIYSTHRSARGVTVDIDRGVDLTRDTATIHFDNAPATPVAGDAARALDRMVDLVNLAVAAEQVGAMRTCLDMTTVYATIRYSFGQPIGAYQGVKHKLADMYNLWALSDAALRTAATASDERLPVAAAAARARTGPSYLTVATNTVLLHGGIGFTWEHDAHLFYRNAIAGKSLLGGLDYQLDRLAGKLAIQENPS
ncbi:MAG: acyl-CoA dehydrogenase [Nocardia sp.]|uniref:acyl-CoA dehydrogenase family protein n=1 Tax=Nocardia sp. TaxID=1821 RepID=UPI00260DA912|nr:acyl-CoA dehydrogenase family protein [Nocardia sp.]MCU1641345.1 acyl-CoA dehydrogenase [Nocardia sp.]